MVVRLWAIAVNKCPLIGAFSVRLLAPAVEVGVNKSQNSHFTTRGRHAHWPEIAQLWQGAPFTRKTVRVVVVVQALQSNNKTVIAPCYIRSQKATHALVTLFQFTRNNDCYERANSCQSDPQAEKIRNTQLFCFAYSERRRLEGAGDFSLLSFLLRLLLYIRHVDQSGVNSPELYRRSLSILLLLAIYYS